ncbi:MAG TPA: class I SAM-dependent methyltransferase [Gemmatimonadaceae bacterium]|nr:class I SAM-dependent methyltransferase [Gemmatimonadaceae bacterium]
MSEQVAKSFQQYVREYEPSEAANDALWEEFARRTREVPFLDRHRTWVEEHRWGFGDRAFHYMWYLLLRDDVLRRADPALLEIGVYKGQVVSLWSLIASELGARARIHAVSPLSVTGRQLRWPLHQFALRLSRRYRADAESGNLSYEPLDYGKAVREIFERFGQDFSAVDVLRGFSEDPAIKQRVADASFDVVYVDGGHRYEQATHDIEYYGGRVKPGGYMVLDDASVFQPGARFWKGHASVSRAAEELDAREWRNVLNVGHNRIYQRLGDSRGGDAAAPGTAAR